MPRPKTLNPRHAAIKNYYKTLAELRSQNVANESALRPAFQNLLAESARLHGWTLITNLSTESRGRTIVPDGTVRDRDRNCRAATGKPSTRPAIVVTNMLPLQVAGNRC